MNKEFLKRDIDLKLREFLNELTYDELEVFKDSKIFLEKTKRIFLEHEEEFLHVYISNLNNYNIRVYTQESFDIDIPMYNEIVEKYNKNILYFMTVKDKRTHLYKEVDKDLLDRIYYTFLGENFEVKEDAVFLMSNKMFHDLTILNIERMYYKEDGKDYYSNVRIKVIPELEDKIILKDKYNKVVFGKEEK